MRVHEILTEVAAADASVAYGYWVTHTGDVLEVDFQNHMPVATKALTDMGFYGSSYMMYRTLGWVAFQVENVESVGGAFDNNDVKSVGWVLNLTADTPDRMTEAATRASIRLLARLERQVDVVGCRIATSRWFGRNHSWMMPEVRKPTAQAAKWLSDNSGKLAEPKFAL